MERTDANNKRILVVEDEPTICNLCRRVLIEDGYEVDIVSDGKAAEESVIKQQYHLLLVDIRLPVESGIEFYDWLQKGNTQLSKQVIFMTGSVMGVETMTLLEKSNRPYLLKPFRPEELVEKVKGSLKGA